MLPEFVVADPLSSRTIHGRTVGCGRWVSRDVCRARGLDREFCGIRGLGRKHVGLVARKSHAENSAYHQILSALLRWGPELRPSCVGRAEKAARCNGPYFQHAFLKEGRSGRQSAHHSRAAIDGAAVHCSVPHASLGVESASGRHRPSSFPGSYGPSCFPAGATAGQAGGELAWGHYPAIATASGLPRIPEQRLPSS